MSTYVNVTSPANRKRANNVFFSNTNDVKDYQSKMERVITRKLDMKVWKKRSLKFMQPMYIEILS